MHIYPRTQVGFAVAALLLGAASVRAGDPPAVAFAQKPGRIEVTVGGQAVATYVMQDDKISRPYFAHLRAPGGTQVSRNHPPVPGKDPTDHDTFHPGLWLAFGDIGGADSWRNKAPVKHEKFIEEPRGGPGRGSFAVGHVYLANDGKRVVCRETCRYTWLVRPAGYLLLWDAELRAVEGDVAFGDQEEMGLGVRLATALTVKSGTGRILNDVGGKNEKGVRGKQADWCDYSGTVAGKRVGVTLMADPNNVRRSWFHARDYGLLVANPFAPKSLGQGAASPVVVKKGEALRLRFGVLVHAGPGEPDLGAAYQDFLKLVAAKAPVDARLGLRSTVSVG